MNKVDIKVATADFERWLDYKRVPEHKRQANKDFEKQIISCIENGSITIDNENKLKLQFEDPYTNKEGKEVLTELVFKPRIRVNELNVKLQGVKSTDADGRVMAYIAAATDKNMGLLGQMYTEDNAICQAIVMYFL